jgi:septum formation protein
MISRNTCRVDATAEVKGDKMNHKIVLASTSPRRKEILSRFTRDFDIIEAAGEERLDPLGDPAVEVMTAALLKGLSAGMRVDKRGLILAADTVVFHESILGKPSDREEAEGMLRTLSGRWHQVFTGYLLMDSEEKRPYVNYAVSEVKFYELSQELITWYLKTGEPLDKAGAYGIQGKGALLVEKIKGDYYNIMGLPIGRIHRDMMRRFNFKFF